ncbi:Entericidin EcnA/B family protein [Methylophilus rhizosphaerae]|uniref:Entericidin EcnA/B family protein n=1 Tax=Methylophilus rhizosphaerae TaxID=492660 RepID=A0A1G8Z621_9PROT|nr:entericidin A/B family lipoprotein [Methylophilus rhizosphaerae]SDK09670.1 Entericidin EcnA/B family protein [Methylophilus rhizosphaerae]
MMSKVMALIAIVMVLAGCNTVNGMGKDMEQAGEAVQRSTK